MSYGRPVSDGNGDNSASAGDRTSNNLSAQVAGYSGAERAAAYSSMSPNGGEQYLPNLNVGNYENVGNSPVAQSAGSDNSGTNASTQNGSDLYADPLRINNGPHQYGRGAGENQYGGEDRWRHHRWEPGPCPPEPGPGPKPPEPGPKPPEPGPNPPEPAPNPISTTTAIQEAQQIDQGATNIDNAVQTGSIATGYSDLTQLLTQWKSQEPNDAASMESQLMQKLANTSTSDGMSGNDVIKDLGVNEVAALFPLFSSGGQVSAASLSVDSQLNSDPANKSLLGGAAQWMEQAGMTGGVSNSVFFAGDIANGALNQQQYQNWLNQPQVRDYATPFQDSSSSASTSSPSQTELN